MLHFLIQISGSNCKSNYSIYLGTDLLFLHLKDETIKFDYFAGDFQ